MIVIDILFICVTSLFVFINCPQTEQGKSHFLLCKITKQNKTNFSLPLGISHISTNVTWVKKKSCVFHSFKQSCARVEIVFSWGVVS